MRCGAVVRPGLANEESATGLLSDLCRAVATAVLGPDAPVRFALYDSAKDFDAVRDRQDDVVFLTPAEAIGQGVAGALVPGPAVFAETTAVMVKDASPTRGLADLAAQGICFLQGEDAQRHLDAWADAHAFGFARMAFQEDLEMWDAFDAGKCAGVARETTTRAASRLGADGRATGGRILPDTLGAFPVLAMTPASDAQWAAVVAWAMDTLIAASDPSTRWRPGGADALPLVGQVPSLSPGWQRAMLDAFESYAAIYRRNLGAASPLRLPSGPNALWPGGVLIAPRAD